MRRHWPTFALVGGLLACQSDVTLEQRQARLRTEQRALVTALEDAGKYDCCTITPCTLCATRAGGCSCGEGLRKGLPVCEECAVLWKAGRGAEPGVDPKTVRSFLQAADEATAKAKCACGEK